MDSYLLDTNLVSVLYDPSRPNHEAVRNAVANLDPTSVKIVSAITLGELRYGLALSKAVGKPTRHIESCIERTENHPLAQVNRHTADAFGLVKSSIAIQRVNIVSRPARWVEAWSDRITSQMLQIDENDLWIAAQAVERNLVIMTSDKDFVDVIAPALPQLRVHFV